MESSLGLYGKMLGRVENVAWEAPGESLSLDSANTVAAGALREGTLLSGGDSHSCLARKHACQQNDSAVLFQLNPLGLQLLPQRLGTGKSKQCS